MAKFKLKTFSEYDALRALYVEMQRVFGYNLKDKINLIDQSALIPVLKGNSVVIEKFVISSRMFGKDRYRMYLKIGAKATMPNDVRLTSRSKINNLGKLNLSFNGGINQKQFGNNNNNNGGGAIISSNWRPDINLSYTTNEVIGETIDYNRSDRSVIFEFKSIIDAIRSLDVLPFGLGYKVYLLGN